MVKIASIAGGVAIACTLSQFPEYSQQYVQRLGGAVDELALVVSDFDASAAASGLSREQALSSMTGGDFLTRRQQDMRRTIARQERLTADYQALRDADAYSRLTYIYHLTDTSITRATWQDFQPAVPLTLDGLVLTVLGYLGGYGALGGLFALGRQRRRKRPA